MDTGELADRWCGAEAGSLVHLAEREGAGLWLQRRVRALGVVLPADVREALASAAKRVVARSAQMDAEATSAFEILDAAGVPTIPLKSTALRRIAGRVPYADARGTIDVDVLVPEAAARAGWEAFIAAGYKAPFGSSAGDHRHLPVVVSPRTGGVEIHLTTLPPVSPGEAWRRATCDEATADFAGRSRPIPGDTELFWHSMAHALSNANGSGRLGIRLRHWLDASAFLAAGAVIDWPRIRARIAAREAAPPAHCQAWLHAAGELAGRPVPDGVMESSSASPFNLERLLSWRLRVAGRYAGEHRWANKLLEEGARGEARLPFGSPQATARPLARLRHRLAASVARGWWRMRR